MKQNLQSVISALFRGGKKAKYIEDPMYELYLASQTKLNGTEFFEFAPIISVLAYGDAKKAEEMLRNQTYGRWEVVSAASEASGEFVTILPEGDVLAEDALQYFVHMINKNMSVDMIFADEDRLCADGKRCEPCFKPDYSETTALSYNSIGLPIAVSKRVFDQATAPRTTDESALYAFALRCAARSDNIIHIPRVLLSRRDKRETIGAEEGIAAVKDYLREKRLGAQIQEGMLPGTFRVLYAHKRRLNVGVVILNNNDPEALRAVLESVDENSCRIPIKLVVVNYGTTDARTQKYYDMLDQNKAAQIIYDEKYNYSKLCNHGAKNTDCDMLLFLNKNIEVLSPAHIEVMMDIANCRNVGAVGPKLISPEGKIAECGLVVGLHGTYGSLYVGENDDTLDVVKNRFINVQRSVSAVSGDCLMIDSDTFFNAGGFDETISSRAAAVELCLRLMRKRLTNVYTPHAVMIRHSYTCEDESPFETDKMRMYDTVRNVLTKGDSYYNPNYDYAFGIPRVAVRPYPPIELNGYYTR